MDVIMMRMPTVLMVATLVAGATWLSTQPMATAAMPAVGDDAPSFTAKASNGQTVALADFKGKSHVVLYFYPKDDTPGCTRQACSVRDTHDEFKELNAVVLGVSFDSVESHRKFVEKHKLPFLLLADMDKAIAKAYGIADEATAMAPRVTFIISKAGKIALVIPKVNPDTHSAEVRQALAGLE